MNEQKICVQKNLLESRGHLRDLFLRERKNFRNSYQSFEFMIKSWCKWWLIKLTAEKERFVEEIWRTSAVRWRFSSNSNNKSDDIVST